MSLRRTLALLAVPALAFAAPPPNDPDGTRLGAVEIRSNQAVNDEVSPQKGDLVDWKRVRLEGKNGEVVVQVTWDEPSADLGVEFFDEDGVALAAAPKRVGLETAKRVVLRAEPGVYYIRIASLLGATVYTLRCRWNGTPPPLPKPDDPSHPRCKVLSSYRDGDGSLVLYLDRGAAAGAKVGMIGQVLAGSEEAILDGGEFKVSKVIDATKSVAKLPPGGLARLGAKNNRCVIHLVSAP